MAKIAQLIEGNYNILDNIPVINQDLTASGFTPVANTYYRHTGATTASFTQGVIYLYDTAYHKLGESGGGTTLNKYEWTLDLTTTVSVDNIKRLSRILKSAKGRVMGSIKISAGWYTMQPFENDIVGLIGANMWYDNEYTVTFFTAQPVADSVLVVNAVKVIASNNAITYNRDNNNPSASIFQTLKVIYYNDTEIT